MDAVTPSSFFYSLLGGILPALVWLAFWLREDKRRPEPRGMIAITFLAGMCAVPAVIPFQLWTERMFPGAGLALLFLAWAIFEEVLKFLAAWFTGLGSKEDNEPLDPLIYMMTAALGFAALENALFILAPLQAGEVLQGVITGNVRFVGATLLHTIAASAIGIALSLSFYKTRIVRIASFTAGLLIAIALHTLFNVLIMQEQAGTMIAAFGFVWIAAVIILLFFEKIKRVYPINTITDV
jgi:RsiW-degrading membrane proteinase PrsW (M82 family)